MALGAVSIIFLSVWRPSATRRELISIVRKRSVSPVENVPAERRNRKSVEWLRPPDFSHNKTVYVSTGNASHRGVGFADHQEAVDPNSQTAAGFVSLQWCDRKSLPAMVISS
jgi:hypothetical protein